MMAAKEIMYLSDRQFRVHIWIFKSRCPHPYEVFYCKYNYKELVKYIQELEYFLPDFQGMMRVQRARTFNKMSNTN